MADVGNASWYEKTGSPTVIIFVHGLFSDSRSCWTAVSESADGESVYWPALVVSDPRLESPSIFMAGFHTAPGARDYDVKHAARELVRALQLPDENGGSPPLDKSHLIFVCHSTGGVVVRYMIEKNQQIFRDKYVGVLLIASPSLGSFYANLFAAFLGFTRQRLGYQLRKTSPELADLDERFRDIVTSGHLQIIGAEAVEHHAVGPRWLPAWLRNWLPRVVEPTSAGRYFGNPEMLRGTDHFSSVKPSGYDHPAHMLLVWFWLAFKKQFLSDHFPQYPRPATTGTRTREQPSVLYGHPYPGAADRLVETTTRSRGQVVACLGPPGSLKSVMLEEVVGRIAAARSTLR